MYGITRLVGVDGDGKNMRVLIQTRRSPGAVPGPDHGLESRGGGTVLIEADEGLSATASSNPGSK